jgi:hypothetical protein
MSERLLHLHRILSSLGKGSAELGRVTALALMRVRFPVADVNID